MGWVPDHVPGTRRQLGTHLRLTADARQSGVRRGDACRPPPVKVAVYVASAFATTLCDCAPPSDQDERCRSFRARVCGDGALSELEEPRITVRSNGATAELEPTVISRPDGIEAKCSTTVFGSSRRVVVAVAPAESRAVSRSSRYDG